MLPIIFHKRIIKMAIIFIFKDAVLKDLDDVKQPNKATRTHTAKERLQRLKKQLIHNLHHTGNGSKKQKLRSNNGHIKPTTLQDD